MKWNPWPRDELGIPVPVLGWQRAGGREIRWEVSLRTRMRFWDLLAELVDLELEPTSPELLERMEALRCDIRALPGYPRQYDPERDLIVPITTSEMG